MGSKKWIISTQKEIQAPSPLLIFYKFDLDPLGGRRTKIKPNKNFGFFLSRPKVAKINVKNQKSVKKKRYWSQI